MIACRRRSPWTGSRPDWGDLTGLVEQAASAETMAWFEGVFRGASTALMGRTNYEGFHGYRAAVARDPESSPRGRDLAVWLDEVEKVVFSRTLHGGGRSNARIADREPADEVAALKAAEGRDILIVNSASIIRALLDAELVDESAPDPGPGGGRRRLRIFADGLPRLEGTLPRRRTSPATRSGCSTAAGADASRTRPWPDLGRSLRPEGAPS